MKTLEELVVSYVNEGFSLIEAESFASQAIILNKIANSPLVDNILIKGGVLMYNLTHDYRRSTVDLDFDFIRYDISEKSIYLFIDLLNKVDTDYKIKIEKLEPLHQEDYKGKRAFVSLFDKTRIIKFKLDIGVHTLLGIKQEKLCFSFDNHLKEVTLRVNPVEQIVAEKLYSLAKHKSLTTRFKDLYDIYYLINQGKLNNKVVNECLMLLIRNNLKFNSLEDVCESINNTFEDRFFLKRMKGSKEKWLDVDDLTILQTILDYIYNL